MSNDDKAAGSLASNSNGTPDQRSGAAAGAADPSVAAKLKVTERQRQLPPQVSRQGTSHGAGTAEGATDEMTCRDLIKDLGQKPSDAWSFANVWRLELKTIAARREHLALLDSPEPNEVIESSQSQTHADSPSEGLTSELKPGLKSEPKLEAISDQESEPNSALNAKVDADVEPAQSTVATPPVAAVDQATAYKTSSLMGLALSGGGIRSAAFNLGILQAFADQRLLGNLDYLSTVSGGGYIGSWLSCWIYRDGDVRNVEKLLSIDRLENAKAARQFRESRSLEIDEDLPEILNPERIHQKEPEPIVHLRANSNYLALRPGLLTPDSWALIAIYLRNILLNTLVVLPTLVAAILFTMGLTSWYDNRQQTTQLLPFAITLVLLSIAVAGVYKTLQHVRDEVDGESENLVGNDSWDDYFGWLVVLTVVASYTLSLDLASPHSWFIYVGTWGVVTATSQLGLESAIILSITLGVLHMLLNWQALYRLLSGDPDRRLILWPASGFVAGVVMGSLICLVTAGLQYLGTKDMQLLPISHIELQALLAVPLLLTSFFVSEVIQLGVLGRLESPEVREKWSAFQARCFMGGLIWFSLVLHVHFISKVLTISQWYSVDLAAVALWLASAAGSLLLAQSPQSSGQPVNSNNRRWKDVLIQAGPPVFLSGLVAGISALVLMGYRHWSVSATDLFADERWTIWLSGGALLAVGLVAGRFVDINVFSLQELYAARLIRCFMGASRRDNRPPQGAEFRTYASLRRADPITAMAPRDDIALALLRTSLSHPHPHTGPLHLINAAVNLTRDIDLQRQERKADSFVFSPIACGNPGLGYRPTAQLPDEQTGYAGGLNLGIAVSLSGAAVSPNMGYYSSPAVTALLTLFNVRLGAWLGNPRSNAKWTQSGPDMGWLHLLKEMMGLTDSTSDYVYISDGGHFDNLGVYELLRRRVGTIFASDAGADPKGSCNELGMVLRKAFVDFGIRIDINTTNLQIDPITGTSQASYAIGTIYYPPLTLPNSDNQVLPAFEGRLIYIKMTRTGHEPTDIATYHRKHPEFPHQSTLYQFYSESQFESYRHLGHCIGDSLLSGKQSRYGEGHPRRAPEQSRSPAQLACYLEYLEAINSIEIPKDWKEQSVALDQRLAALFGQLETKRGLVKLRAEVLKVTEILDVCEELSHKRKHSTDWNSLNERRELLRQQLVQLQGVSRSDWESTQENAWMMEAVTLINTVITSLKADKYFSAWRTEWIRILRQWMCTSTFQRMWRTIRKSFVPERDSFVCSLLEDAEWVNVRLSEKPGQAD